MRLDLDVPRLAIKLGTKEDALERQLAADRLLLRRFANQLVETTQGGNAQSSAMARAVLAWLDSDPVREGP
jgi:ABC-type thiamine transport system ATPase subunit